MTTSVEKVNGTPVASEPRLDPVRAAEAEAIRARAAAERQALLTAAEGEKALKLEQAEQLRLANDKTRMANETAALRLERTRATEQTKIAEERAKQEQIDRGRAEEQRQFEEQQQTENQQAAEVEAADDKWRRYALNFYRVCAVVALPVQLNAFYDPNALWLMAAPLMLEGGAWVVQKGAAAAVANGRPAWHYRLISWLLAFIAAGINLWHGLQAFDPATAIGTAFASIAGPGVWDLHEHGRIRKRDGVPTRRERKAAKKAARAEAKAKAAEEEQKRVDKRAADEAAERAWQELRQIRQTVFEKVWAEAVKIGAAVGKEPDDPAVWPRAYRNIEGCDPGESIESITSRRKAEARVEAALTGTPVSTLSKTTNAQRAAQMPAGPNRVLKTRATRRPGDTQKYSTAARKQASIAARNAAKKD